MTQTWLIKYKILVRMCVHFLALTGDSLNVRHSCNTDVLSMFWNGLPPPSFEWEDLYLVIFTEFHSNNFSDNKNWRNLFPKCVHRIGSALILIRLCQQLTIFFFFLIAFKRTHFTCSMYAVITYESHAPSLWRKKYSRFSNVTFFILKVKK